VIIVVLVIDFIGVLSLFFNFKLNGCKFKFREAIQYYNITDDLKKKIQIEHIIEDHIQVQENALKEKEVMDNLTKQMGGSKTNGFGANKNKIGAIEKPLPSLLGRSANNKEDTINHGGEVGLFGET
jgi:hypothetical protein